MRRSPDEERRLPHSDTAGEGAAPHAVLTERSPDLARKLYYLTCEEIEGGYPKAAEILEDAEANTLAHFDFPYAYHRRLHTNNVQGRTNGEFERLFRAVQVFPSKRPLIRMLGAAFAEMDKDWQPRRRFMEDSIAQTYGGKANALRPSYEGRLDEHAGRIIEFVMADNPIGGKAAWGMV